SIIHLQPGHDTIKMRIEAESAQFQENNREEHTSIWLFEQPRIWEFDAQGQLTTYTAEAGSKIIALEEDLPTILAQQRKPEEMNFHQLRERIRILDARDQPTYDLRTDLFRKITYP